MPAVMEPRSQSLFGNAPLGAVSLVLTVLSMLLFRLGVGLIGAKAVGMLFLLLPPAVLSAVYSLFFEVSKLYGCLALLLASVILVTQPFTWYWLKSYFPVGVAFILFCGVVWILKCKLGR